MSILARNATVAYGAPAIPCASPPHKAVYVEPTSSRHPKFFFPDGNAVFLVEDTLFKVHRYFFQRDSPIFAAMFTLPSPPGGTPEGDSESNPIGLEGIKAIDFERFLSILYPQSFRRCDVATVAEWTSVLHIASLWQFGSLRRLSLDNLAHITSPIQHIALGKQFDVPSWLVPAYTEICVRAEPLTLEEGKELGLVDVIKIGQVRHQIRYVTNLNRHEDTILMLVADRFGNRG